MENIRKFRIYVHREPDGTKAIAISEKNKQDDDFRCKLIYLGKASQRDAVSSARLLIIGELKDNEIASVRTNLLCPPNKAYSTERFKLKRGKILNRNIIELAEKAHREQLETDWAQLTATKKTYEQPIKASKSHKEKLKAPSKPKEKKDNRFKPTFKLSEILSEQDRRKLYGIK